MLIIDPLADIVRTMLNVGLNCMIPTLATSRSVIRTERGT
jgi:L-cystine uptake protein TcyP (sodium:dicarboxylate symporter family)